MAYTLNTFVIEDESYYSGYTEVLSQASLDLNAMNGTMILENRNMKGELEKASFFEAIGSDAIIQDRDPTSLAAASWNDLTMGETVGVRSWKTMKEKKAISAFRALGEDLSTLSFVLGTQHAKAVALDYMNTGVAALVGALSSEASMTFDATTSSSPTFTPENLVRMRQKLGDASGNLVGIVMHSQMASDYLADAVTSQVDTVAGNSIFLGTIGTMQIPIFVTDSDSLVNLDPAGDGTAPAKYAVLGLTRNALRLTEAQERDILTRTDDSAANLAVQMTTEWSYFINVKGFSWTGGQYPTKGDLSTAANWDYVYTQGAKTGPGVVAYFTARDDAA